MKRKRKKMLKFISGNSNKFKELKETLTPIDFEQLSIDLEEIQDLDAKKVITHKVEEAYKHYKGEFIIEDAYSYFECLDYKLPGPFIKWFNQTLGNRGIFKLAEKTEKFRMSHIVTIAYAKSPKNILFFSGVTNGKIVKPKGKGGFGFDPIFLPDGSKKTIAEMKANNYLKFSARFKAALKLKQYLLK